LGPGSSGRAIGPVWPASPGCVDGLPHDQRWLPHSEDRPSSFLTPCLGFCATSLPLFRLSNANGVMRQTPPTLQVRQFLCACLRRFRQYRRSPCNKRAIASAQGIRNAHCEGCGLFPVDLGPGHEGRHEPSLLRVMRHPDPRLNVKHGRRAERLRRSNVRHRSMPVRVRGMGSFRRSQSREKPTPALHYSVVRRDLAYSLTR
jgi:hypothetical protein